MKKVIKFSMIILSLFITIQTTIAFYNSNTKLVNPIVTEKYNIRINGSGGIFSSKDVVISQGMTTLPIPVKKGYTFLGYSNSINGNVNFNYAIDNIEKINNKTIYAKWNVDRYSINYNLNGGNIDNPKTSYTVEENIILQTPTRKGYIFNGWTEGNSIPKGSIGNKTFTANWSVNRYSINYNLNGGEIDNPKTSYTVEENITLKTPTKIGHTFTGWTGGNNIPKGSTGNKTFTANWSVNSYTVTYLVDGNVWQSKKINYGDKIPTDKPTTDNWHHFYGWNNYQNTMPNYDVTLTGTIDFTKCSITTGHSQPNQEPWRTDKFIKELASVGIIGWKEDYGNGGGKYVTTAQIYPINKIESGFSKMWNSSGSTLRWVHIQCDNGYSYVKTR